MEEEIGRIDDSPWYEAVDLGEQRSFASKAIFVVLLATLAFATIVFGAVDPATWVILFVGAAVVASLWFADAWRAGAVLINADALLLPIIGLILIGVVQWVPLFAADGAQRSSISVDPYATRLFVGRLIIYLLFFAAALTYLNNKRRLKAAVIFTITFGALMAIFAILQRLGGADSIYGIRDTPGAISFGPFVNQHHFAAFMEMTGGLAFGFLFGPKTGRQTRIMAGAAATIMGIALVITSSRGGLISFVGALLFAIAANVFVLRRVFSKEEGIAGARPRLALFSLGAALLMLIFGLVLFLGADSSLIRSLGFVGGDVTSGRTHFWSVALQVFADHPLLGAGLDAFGAAFTRYDTWPGIFRIEQAHNDYLQTLADAGIAGFACIAAFIYLLFKKAIATISETRDDLRRSAALGALCGCFGILVHSFFDFPLRTPSNAFFFLMLVAIAVVRLAPKRRQRTLTESSF